MKKLLTILLLCASVCYGQSMPLLQDGRWLGLTLTSAQGIVVTNGLTAYYEFDGYRILGTNIVLDSISTNHGFSIWASSAFGVNGASNTAINFDTVGEYASISNNNVFNPKSNDWTITCWYYYTNAAANVIFNRLINSASFGIYCGLAGVQKLTLYASHESGSWNVGSSVGDVLPLNTWIFLAWQHSGSTCYGWVNSNKYTFVGSLTNLLDNNTPSWIGAQYATGLAGPRGRVDNLRIYNNTFVSSNDMLTIIGARQ